MMDQIEMRSQPFPIRSVSILGAGTMGSGIALVNVRAGITVKLFDIDQTAAARAVDRILKDQATSSQSVSVATSEREIAQADLIIEAVPEDEHLKKAILERLNPCLDRHKEVIVASNSSSIPITRLATAIQTPQRMCGLHFCHPVIDRSLVEVVETKLTSPETIDQVVQYVRSLGKDPLRVRDSPGFLLNRLLVPYFNTALDLVLEGVEPEELDQAAEAFGMPAGPLWLLDEFGLDVALAVGKTMYQAFPNRIAPSELLIAMYKARRWGRKSGSGFYAPATDGARPTLDPQTVELIQSRRRSLKNLSPGVVSQRLLLPMVLEATRVCEERIIDDPALIDLALRNGLGMTGRFQGLFAWAESVGLQQTGIDGRRLG
jgi:3-hydroxyacyl-CoA dehydrogenase